MNASKLKIGIFPQLINGFKVSNLDYEYSLDFEVKKGVHEFIILMKKVGIEIVDLCSINENNLVFGEIVQLISRLLVAFFKCMPTCLKFSYNRYFNDTDRFDIDSPYHSFDDILSKPKLLSRSSLNLLTKAAKSMNESSETQYCQIYDTLQKDLIKIMLDDVKLAEYDALLMPTSTSVPYFHENNSFTTETDVFGMDIFFLSIFTKFPVLNIPAWYSDKKYQLPVGIMLVSKPNRFNNTLQIAGILEKIKNLNKLPKSTPLLRDFKSVNKSCP